MGMRDSTINISDFFMASPRESVNKSAASAASLDSVEFQAVIKSAASAASRKTKSWGPSSRKASDGGSACGRRGTGFSPGAWSPGFDLPGASASSSLDDGLKIYVL